MAYTSIVIDDFYNNPDEVRAFALDQDFSVLGNFPGRRTLPSLNDSTKDYISAHMPPLHGEIQWAHEEYTGSFQIVSSTDTTWVHADEWNHWAGVLYLTPDAPVSGGTGIFKHKETGLYKIPRLSDGTIDRELTNKIYNDAGDISKWEMIDYIGNVYNRLVIYQGDLFHSALGYFGSDKEDGRLFQTFFFNTTN